MKFWLPESGGVGGLIFGFTVVLPSATIAYAIGGAPAMAATFAVMLLYAVAMVLKGWPR